MPAPENILPMLATLVDQPPTGEDWLFELKWDGFRTLAYCSKNTATLRSRNNKDFTQKYYPLTQALAAKNWNVVLDGELVVVNDQGFPDFEAIQLWRSEADGALRFYVFDILYKDNKSQMERPLTERRKVLEALFKNNKDQIIRLSPIFAGSGEEAFKHARESHLEGIMAKKRNSLYIPDSRSKDWMKVKTEKRQELIIGGYTKNEGTSKLFSALLMGILRNGQFDFLTPVGTGFSKAMQEAVLKALKPHIRKTNPFSTEPEYNKPSRFRPDPPKAEVTWVNPVVVGEISYREMTRGGAIRQPSFKGLRPDKQAFEVVIEKPQAVKEAQKEQALVKAKLITAPGKQARATLLNPVEASQTRIIEGKELKFTNLSKLYWPKEGISKRDMINYYYQVAPIMLPYLKDKPQILNRHPNGIAGKTFYQKDVKGKAPDWIRTYPYYSYMDQREKEFLVCTDEASLLYMASLGCIEINPWHSRTRNPDKPDWFILDLDPDGNPFSEVIQTAKTIFDLLDLMKIEGYCKTSGSTGLHIYLPLKAKYDYEVVKEFGRSIAKVTHQLLPKFTSIERKTNDRKGKLYIDFLQNRPQASVAAPYSLRPKPGATVSMPIHREELTKELTINKFNIKTAVSRLREMGDIFTPVLGKGISIPSALKLLEEAYPQWLTSPRKKTKNPG